MIMPYRYRGLAMLSALIVLLPAAAWRYALRDTVLTAMECRRLYAQTTDVQDMPAESESASVGTRDMLLSGLLLDHIGGDVLVSAYTPAVTKRQGRLAVHTAELTLTGTFAGLLQALYRIECETPECIVRSVRWHLTTDRGAGGERLLLTMYVQQLVKTENI